MALFSPGWKCRVCGDPILSESDVVTFSRFVSNRLDPIHIFDDAILHVACFRQHPLAKTAQTRWDEYCQRTEPGNRKCDVCGKEIADPDEYVGFGHLVAAPGHPMHRFNYAKLHEACASNWSALHEAISGIEELKASADWSGDDLEPLLQALRRSIS